MVEFSKEMTPAEFKEQYWYKADLEAICRQQQLPTYGTKAELTAYILDYLSGKAASDIVPVRKNHRLKKSLTADEITLDTKLLDSGFSLNNEARVFFQSYLGLDKFSFKKAMAIKLREVEVGQDHSATVADLVAILENPQLSPIANKEEKTYQWNQFVKEFNQDPLSKQYHSPIKVASILWQHVRQSRREKIYHSDLLEEYAEKITPFLKSSVAGKRN
ncbi:SAP domain-containing protein [Streptococcus merionis]|uniref:Cytoplasmic protein n=1 Tax=Streptococcus merionis TaxID=400065 RepID=A0A239SPJ0_9STRE|nr:SAP domain-containing protein [Streptococcus merionis]SNU86563.1 cytoplasmic protein [Streptococcus merionis]